MRSCPSCSAPAKSGDRFCGQCGAPLEPELPGGETPAGRPAARLTRSRFLLVAAIVIAAVIVAAAAGILLFRNSVATPSAWGPANASGSGGNGSYVLVWTEEPAPTATRVPDTTALPAATPATSPATPQSTKAIFCAADQRKCNNTCVDLNTNRGHCGTCNHACPANQTCVNGECQTACWPGKTACPGGCYNLQTDPDHCGTCGNNCPAGLICEKGQCTAPATPMIVAV